MIRTRLRLLVLQKKKNNAPYIAVYDTNTALLRCLYIIQMTKENMHRNQISAQIQEIYSHCLSKKLTSLFIKVFGDLA